MVKTGVTHSHTAKGRKKQINYHFVNNPNMRQQQCTSSFPIFLNRKFIPIRDICWVTRVSCTSYVINRNFRAKIMSWIPGEIRLSVNVCMYVSLSYIKHIVSSSKLKECDSYCWRWGARKWEINKQIETWAETRSNPKSCNAAFEIYCLFFIASAAERTWRRTLDNCQQQVGNRSFQR